MNLLEAPLLSCEVVSEWVGMLYNPNVSQPIFFCVAAPAVEVKQEPKKEASKGAYVPPSMRRAMANQAEGRDQSWKYRSGARERDPRRPPEIASEIAFPTLQASTASSKR